MLGKSHLIIGATGWLAAAPALSSFGVDLDPAQIGAGTVIAAGSAMIPDLDHPKATISSSLGPITRFISKIFAKSLGGHRNGSHSLFFAAISGLMLNWLMFDIPLLTIFFMTILTSSLLLRTLAEVEGITCFVLSVILAGVIATICVDQPIVVVAATVIGILLHDLADALTPEGVPLFWPLNKTRFKIPITKTGATREKIIAGLSGLVAAFLFINLVVSPNLDSGPEQVKAKYRAEKSKVRD